MPILLNARALSLIECPDLIQLTPGLPNRRRLTRALTGIAHVIERSQITKLAQTKFLSIQFDGWTDRVNRKLLGVIGHVQYDGKFWYCHLSTVSVESLHANVPFIRGHIGEILAKDNLTPESTATDTNSTQETALAELYRRRQEKTLPPIALFPRARHVLNSILKEFCTMGVENLAAMRNLRNALGGVLYSQRGPTRQSPGMTFARWSSVCRMPRAILVLPGTICDFLGVSPAFKMAKYIFGRAEQAHPMLRLLRDLFLQFGADGFGNILKVDPAFVSIRRQSEKGRSRRSFNPGLNLSKIQRLTLSTCKNRRYHTIFTLDVLRTIDDFVIATLIAETRSPAEMARERAKQTLWPNQRDIVHLRHSASVVQSEHSCRNSASDSCSRRRRNEGRAP
jgi:hypothetical protein